MCDHTYICNFINFKLIVISETKDCFDHLVRIIAQKAALFSENNRHRRIPKDFPASSTGTLSDLITWLMPWTAKYEKETRHKAMEALFNLSRDLKVSVIQVRIDEGLAVKIGCYMRS